MEFRWTRAMTGSVALLFALVLATTVCAVKVRWIGASLEDAAIFVGGKIQWTPQPTESEEAFSEAMSTIRSYLLWKNLLIVISIVLICQIVVMISQWNKKRRAER